jgi:hypothetical protein
MACNISREDHSGLNAIVLEMGNHLQPVCYLEGKCQPVGSLAVVGKYNPRNTAQVLEIPFNVATANV